MNSNIDFDLYKMFYQVVKAGSFSKAADELYISQSAVTQAIQKLEDQIGGILFIRSRKGVTLTEAGKVLFEYIAPSIETIGNAEDIFSKYQNMEMGTIRISSSFILYEKVLRNSIIRFCKDHPKIEFEVDNNKTLDAIKKLETGLLDLVLLYVDPDNDYGKVKIIDLIETEDVFFVNKNYYEKIKNDKISFKNLSNYKLILPKRGTNARRLIDKKVEKQGEKLNANYVLSSPKLLIDFVKSFDAIGFTNKHIIREELESGELMILDIGLKENKSKIGLACLDKKIINVATLKLIDYIKEDCKKMK